MLRAAVVLLLPLAALAAPVPAHLMPRMEVQLRHNPNDHPLGNNYEIVLRNTGSSDLQVWTNQPYGLAAFLDLEVLNAKGDRVSRPYPWSTSTDKDAKVVLRATIPAKKSHSTTLPIFNCVDDKKLVPGSYKLRVRFRYKDHDAVSEWLPVDVSESEIRTKHLVLGP